jgi:hypothetical protein
VELSFSKGAYLKESHGRTVGSTCRCGSGSTGRGSTLRRVSTPMPLEEGKAPFVDEKAVAGSA